MSQSLPVCCRITVWSVLWTGSSVTLMTWMQRLPWISQKGVQQLSQSPNRFLWAPKCVMDLEVSPRCKDMAVSFLGSVGRVPLLRSWNLVFGL